MSASGMPTSSEPGFYRCDAGCGRKTQHRAADGQTPACRGKCTAAVNAALASSLQEQSQSNPTPGVPNSTADTEGNTNHES